MLEIDEGSIGPQALAELVTSDHVAGALEHHTENLERLLLEPDAATVLAQLARTNVQLE